MKACFKTIILTAVFGIPAALFSADNLILNPSFEEMDPAGRLPLHWTTLQTGIDGSFHSVGGKDAVSGTRAAQLECRNSALNIRNYVLWKQDHVQRMFKDIAPGTEMEFSVMVKAEPDVKFHVYLEMMGQKNEYFGYAGKVFTAKSGNWEKYSFQFKMPEQNAKNAYVCLQLVSPGKISFDDVCLKRAGEKK
mgnify:CR=1 FL=1